MSIEMESEIEEHFDLSPELYPDDIRKILNNTVELLEDSRQGCLKRRDESLDLRGVRSPSNSDMVIGGDVAKREEHFADILQDAIGMILGTNPEVALNTAIKVLSKKPDIYQADIESLRGELWGIQHDKAA